MKRENIKKQRFVGELNRYRWTRAIVNTVKTCRISKTSTTGFLFVTIGSGGGCGGASSAPIASKRVEIPRLACSPFLDLAEHNAQ